MGRRGVPNPEPAQGSQRPGLRGPGAEVVRLIGYPVVRQVLADLGQWSRRPSQFGRECGADGTNGVAFGT